jgi:hypothetical protein
VHLREMAGCTLGAGVGVRGGTTLGEWTGILGGAVEGLGFGAWVGGGA